MTKPRESHKVKMARKAARRDQWHAGANEPSRLVAFRKHGAARNYSIALLDHKHAREIARRNRRAGK